MSARTARRGRVYLDHGTWWTDFSHGGARYRERAEEASNEREAWDELDKRRAAVLESRRPAHDGDPFPSLATRFRLRCEVKELTPKTRVRWEGILEQHLEPFFRSESARQIRERVDAYAVTRRGEGAKPATVQLELPGIEVRNTRKGFLEVEQVRSIAEHLPPALRPLTWFAFYTGWRKGEVLGLEWRNIDLDAGVARLEPGETKSGEGREFPIGEHPELVPLLRAQRDATTALERTTGQIVRWVFHRDGAKILNIDAAWKTAARKAGLPGKLFHDLRRSAALQLRRLGAAESDIMEWCGWETRSMFKRYSVKDSKGSAHRMRVAMSGRREAGSAGPST